MGYKPSPRPTFDRPTALPFADVTRHTWGNPAAGLVDDWIYVSSDLLHTIIFGIDPGEMHFGIRRTSARSSARTRYSTSCRAPS